MTSAHFELHLRDLSEWVVRTLQALLFGSFSTAMRLCWLVGSFVSACVRKLLTVVVVVGSLDGLDSTLRQKQTNKSHKNPFLPSLFCFFPLPYLLCLSSYSNLLLRTTVCVHNAHNAKKSWFVRTTWSTFTLGKRGTSSPILQYTVGRCIFSSYI